MAGARSALILATDAYTDPGLTSLRAPEHDTAALASVLGDPDIGDFSVESVVNQPSHEIARAVARFFTGRRPEDLLLLYISCHGVKDHSGELYFAATDTRLDLLEATGVSSSFVKRMMDRSRAAQVLLLLDCRYSGDLARGMASRASGPVDINERLGGRGRAVITASSALQFAFEGEELPDGNVEATEPSVFTRALVAGLRSGEADRDLDGWVTVDELYAYLHDEVTRVAPDQTPKKWSLDVQGDLYVARRGTPVSTPAALPDQVREALQSLAPWEREGVVEPLTAILQGNHPGRSLAARLALEKLAEDDSNRVRWAARAVLHSSLVLPVEPVSPSPETLEALEPMPPAPSQRPSPMPQVEPTGSARAGPSKADRPSYWQRRRGRVNRESRSSSAPAASQDGISDAISRYVSKGSLLFDPPSQMRQGRPERVEVALATTTGLDDELRALLGVTASAPIERVETTPFMEVELRGAAFDIVPLQAGGGSEQLLHPLARWQFDVTPQLSGHRRLQLLIAMRIPLPDRPDERVSVPVLEREIHVTVDARYSASRFVGSHWQWLVATIAGLGGALAAWIKLVQN